MHFPGSKLGLLQRLQGIKTVFSISALLRKQHPFRWSLNRKTGLRAARELHCHIPCLEGKRRKDVKLFSPLKQRTSRHQSTLSPVYIIIEYGYFLWFFCSVFIVSILQILLYQAGCHQDLSRKDWVGNTCQNTVIFKQ